MHKLSARAQGNPACAIIWEARAALIPLAPSRGPSKKDAVFFWGGIGGAVERSETEGVILLYLPQRGILLAEEIMVHEFLLLRKTNAVRGGDG